MLNQEQSFFFVNTPKSSTSNMSMQGQWIVKELKMEGLMEVNVSKNERVLEELGTQLGNLNRSTYVDLKRVMDLSNQAWNIQSINLSMSVVGVVVVAMVAGMTIYCVRRYKKKPPSEVQMEFILKNLVDRLERTP